ncbi:hypothetical protein EIP91_009451 [Steccherinum ochraceum]|uniref:Uncharacterized protein n=1 Tax=Steccherinum ochraceum TaxID=92696 RepID=A0A4R0RKA1_9APHY|nr:hypothetical protein EIP91_009451 [Steccherinum ochraceum]
MEAVQYDTLTQDHQYSMLQTRSHLVDDHSLHLDLHGHMSTYLATPNPYLHDPYATQSSAINTQHIYDGALNDPYIGSQSEAWPNYMFSHTVPGTTATYAQQQHPPQPIHHYSPPSSAGHYGTSSLSYATSKPVLSRHSSQRSWHSDRGDTTHADGNQRPSTGVHTTPLNTVPMLPILVGSTQSPSGVSTARADNKDALPVPEQPDPFAARFLKEQLGDEKWDIFTSRLAENRKNGSRSRMKVALTAALESGNTEFTDFGGASAIDFLVKVEVVKGVLRAFVPHPYNPQKSMSHPYTTSPKGHVVVSRSSVLTLSGWSNTQFAYWARRAEGVSVLCNRDRRLRTVAKALERRLREVGIFESSPLFPDSPAQEFSFDLKSASPRSSVATPRSDPGAVAKDEPIDEKLAIDEIEIMDPERWVKTFVTGKGLDVIIDEVKKRCGVSQFLRGKHSSLDPFGASLDGDDSPSAPAVRGETSQVFMPTFQAESYVHESPTEQVKDEMGSPTAFNDPSSEVTGSKRKASIDIRRAHDDASPMAQEASQDFLVPSTSFTISQSPISPISPLSPNSTISMSTGSSSSSVPNANINIRSKLNMESIHLSDQSGDNYTTFTRSLPITPLAPTGLVQAGPDHFHYDHHSHPRRVYSHPAQEFELAQAHGAETFQLSPDTLPERRYKKQRLLPVPNEMSAAGAAVTPNQGAAVAHSLGGGVADGGDAQMRGYHHNHHPSMGVVVHQQAAGSGPTSPPSWHAGHNATLA